MVRKGVVYQQGQPFSAGSVLVNTDRLIVGVIGTANSSPSGASFAPPVDAESRRYECRPRRRAGPAPSRSRSSGSPAAARRRS